MKKQSNPKSIFKRPPPPPMPPPYRTFKNTMFNLLIETKESKQKTKDWENYMKGYKDGMNYEH